MFSGVEGLGWVGGLWFHKGFRGEEFGEVERRRDVSHGMRSLLKFLYYIRIHSSVDGASAPWPLAISAGAQPASLTLRSAVVTLLALGFMRQS